MPNIISPEFRPTESPAQWAERTAQRSLGSNTKSASPLDTPNTPQSQQRRGIRAARHALQNSIRTGFLRDSDFDPDNPDWEVYNDLPRVVKCKRARVSPTADFYIENGSDPRAHVGGIASCGSVWTCPVCAAAIQEQRRLEIAQAIDWAYDNGYRPVFVTLTAPHYRRQKCDDLLTGFASALKYLRSGKVFQRIKADYGFIGLIRSLETLHGANGWHNHTHEIWFLDANADVSEFTSRIQNRWEKACDSRGLIPKGKLKAFRKYSVDVKDWVESSREEVKAVWSEYAQKHDDVKYLTWGADKEMVGHLTKTSRIGSLHPFQLAAAYGEEGCMKSWRLFCEYADAFKGRAVCYWSPGLKKLVGVVDASDEEIADMLPGDPRDPEFVGPPSIEYLLSLCHFGWRAVKDEIGLAGWLDYLEKHGTVGAIAWLSRRGLHPVDKGFIPEIPDFMVPKLVNLKQYPE